MFSFLQTPAIPNESVEWTKCITSINLRMHAHRESWVFSPFRVHDDHFRGLHTPHSCSVLEPVILAVPWMLDRLRRRTIADNKVSVERQSVSRERECERVAAPVRPRLGNRWRVRDKKHSTRLPVCAWSGTQMWDTS